MKTKYFLMIGFLVLLVSGVFFPGIIFNNSSKNKPVPVVTKIVYQGPVPKGYDEGYFRKIGITREVQP